MPDVLNATNLEPLRATPAPEFAKLEMEIRASAAASLAGAMIAATGRPHSLGETVKLWQRVRYEIDRRLDRGGTNREISEREHPLDKKHE